MYVIDPKQFDPVMDALGQFLGKPMIASGSTKKATEVNAAEQSATIESYAGCIALMLTDRRRVVYADLEEKLLPMVETWPVQKLLQEYKPQYRALTMSHGPDSSNEKSALLHEVYTKLLNLISDEHLDRSLETQRRKAILEGRIEPQPSDAEWLNEERARLSQTANPYDKALEKLGRV